MVELEHRVDPAANDQVILTNLPFWVDTLHFGDLRRVGRGKPGTILPVLEVVVASGHAHLMAIVGPYAR